MGDDTRIRPERVTETYAIAIWKRLVLWVVDGHTPFEELERLRHLVREWGRRQGTEKSVALVVIHDRRTTMSAEERRSVAKMIDESKHSRSDLPDGRW